MEDQTKDKRPWYTGDNSWPNVFIKKSERTEEFYRAAIDYALQRHRNRKTQVQEITALKESYNGNTSSESITKLNQMYGKEFHAVYKDYNLSRRKADQLGGEFLDSNLSGTLYAINQMAMEEKRQVSDIVNGMKLYKAQIQKLREEELADPYDGFQPPEEQNEEVKSTFQRMSGRTKNEFIMQKFTDEQIKVRNIKDRLYYNLMDAVFANEMFGKIELDETGDANYRNIDCRNRLAEEIDGDIMLKKSPYMGEIRWMFINEIFEEMPELLKNETIAKKLRSLSASYDPSVEPSPNLHKDDTGGLMFKVATIEMYCYDTTYFKTYKGKEDDVTEMSSAYVEDKKRSRRIKNDLKNNKYELLQKIKKTLCSVSKIGDELYVYHNEVPYIIGSYENPYDTEYNYTCMTFGTQNGRRTSIFKALEDIKFEYNVARMIINRELFKSKGLAMGYDRQFLPVVNGTTMTMNDVITKIVNDGIIDYNGANEGNLGLDQRHAIDSHLKVIDMGMSKMIPQVLQIAYDCERIADLISGVNKERQGTTPASQTATTAGNNMQQSRATTANIFYYFNRYTAEIFRKLVERRKIGIAYIKLAEDDAEAIVGHEALGYLKATKDIAKYDYAYYISDGRKEQHIRQILREYLPNALQTGEMAPQDFVMMEMQESLAEVYTTLKSGWNVIKKHAAASEDKQMQSIAANEERKLQVQIENREDMQKHEAALKTLEGTIKAGIAGQQAMNDYVTNSKLQEQAAQEQQMQEMQ